MSLHAITYAPLRVTYDTERLKASLNFHSTHTRVLGNGKRMIHQKCSYLRCHAPGFIPRAAVCLCLCASLGNDGFLTESAAKFQLCDAHVVQFSFLLFLRHWHREADSIPIITGVVLYKAACKYLDSDTSCCFACVLQQRDSKGSNH